MTILTNLPVTAICGTPQVVTIDKAQFVIDFGIVDAFWSNPANWQEIEFYYVNSANGLQVKKMSFAGNTYSLNLKTTVWNGTEQCQKITLMDGTGNTLAFARASFPTASEFDFDSTGGYSPAPPTAWTFGTADIASAGGGELHRTGGVGDWANSAWQVAPISGDFTFSGTFLQGAAASDVMIGYHYPTTPVSDTAITNTLTSGIYIHGIVTMCTGYGGGGIPDFGTSVVQPSTNTFEIKRVGSLITGKLNGIQIYHETYSLPVYACCIIYQDSGSSIGASTII